MTDLNPAHGRVIALALPNGQLIRNNDDIDENADIFEVVINLGREDEIAAGTRFLLFSLGDELIDFDSGENLGHFEIVKGIGKVTNLQVKMATLRSQRTKTISQARNALQALNNIFPETVTREVAAPFVKPRVGDFIRLV